MQIPALQESTLVVEPDAEWRKPYDKMRLMYRYSDNMLAESLIEALHAMRRMTLVPKLQATLRLLQDVDHDAVVFTW